MFKVGCTKTTNDQKRDEDLKTLIGHNFNSTRKATILNAISNNWTMAQSPPFKTYDLVVAYPLHATPTLYQMRGSQ